MTFSDYKKAIVGPILICVSIGLAQTQSAHAAPATFDPVNPLEEVYTSVPPCRFFDTRKTTAIPPNQIRIIYAAGTVGFAPQGGKNGGCNVPSYATSVTTQITVLSASRSGGLLASAAPGTTTAQAYVTSFPAGGVATDPVVGIATGSVAVELANNQIAIYSRYATTQVVGEINGYFAPQIRAQISDAGAILSGTSRILSVVRSGLGTYDIKIDRDVSQCAATVSTGDTFRYVSATTVPGVANTNLIRVSAWLTVLGIPTRSNVDFQIAVHC